MPLRLECLFLVLVPAVGLQESVQEQDLPE
jgi:hypothetical protein